MDPEFVDTEFQPERYFELLQPIVYETLEAAKKVTFKSFISNNIRKHLPAVYKGLVSDWKAIELWKDGSYFVQKIGKEVVEAIGFLREEPFPFYAGNGMAPN